MMDGILNPNQSSVAKAYNEFPHERRKSPLLEEIVDVMEELGKFHL